VIAFTILAPAPYINANDRLHYMAHARLVNTWRAHVAAAARRYTPAITTWPIDLHVRLDVPDNRRRDPQNLYPMVKVICDALGPALAPVGKRRTYAPGAGWWPDDTPEYVRTHEPELRVVGRKTPLTVTITVKERT